MNIPYLKTNLIRDGFYTKLAILVAFCLLIFLLSNSAFSADVAATDYLKGTDAGLKATLKGTGRNFIIILDGGAALLAFITRKNPIIFSSVVGVTVFTNILIALAGG